MAVRKSVGLGRLPSSSLIAAVLLLWWFQQKKQPPMPAHAAATKPSASTIFGPALGTGPKDLGASAPIERSSATGK